MLYEVRIAGKTRRLYTNSVHHSQYNPGRIISNGIWDLLMIPSFFYPQGKINRVLVLGVGGGSVLHLLQNYIQPAEIIGIELNPVHLYVAKKFFGVQKNVATLIEDDAIDWMMRYDGAPFDMIIDDLYGDEDGEPKRAVKLTASWLDVLNRSLAVNGMLVFNTIGPRELKDSAYYSNVRIRRLFKACYRLSLPFYDNCIGVYLKTDSSVRLLRKHIRQINDAKARRELEKLDFRVYRA